MERQLAAAEEGAAVDKAELTNLGQQMQEHAAMEGQLAAAEEAAAKDKAELLNLRQQLQELGTSMSLMQQQVGSACCDVSHIMWQSHDATQARLLLRHYVRHINLAVPCTSAPNRVSSLQVCMRACLAQYV